MEKHLKLKTSGGFTVWVAFGSYGGFNVQYRKKFYLRLCFGWCSIVFIRCDIENTIEKMQDIERHLIKELKNCGVTVTQYNANGNPLD